MLPRNLSCKNHLALGNHAYNVETPWMVPQAQHTEVSKFSSFFPKYFLFSREKSYNKFLCTKQSRCNNYYFYYDPRLVETRLRDSRVQKTDFLHFLAVLISREQLYWRARKLSSELRDAAKDYYGLRITIYPRPGCRQGGDGLLLPCSPRALNFFSLQFTMFIHRQLDKVCIINERCQSQWRGCLYQPSLIYSWIQSRKWHLPETRVASAERSEVKMFTRQYYEKA